MTPALLTHHAPELFLRDGGEFLSTARLDSSALATLALTVPFVLIIGLVTGHTIKLGLDGDNTILLMLTILVSMLTFGGGRTNMLQGAVHILLFLSFILLIFSP